MSASKKFFKSYEVKLNNNEKRTVYVYKKGRSIFLSDGMGEILVHPSNENSEEGWFVEYGIQKNVIISSYKPLNN